MSVIARDIASPALAAAVEANQCEALTQWRALPGVDFHDGAGLLWVISGIPHPLCNGVYRADLTRDDLDATIAATLARFRERRAPMFWYVGPATRPIDLGERLAAHGLTQTAEVPGMAADLRALPEERVAPPGLTIERVRDITALRDYVRVLGACFGFPDELGEAFVALFASAGFAEQAPWRHYVGRLNGDMVTTASLFLGAGAAGIYNVATAPEARRRGLGTAVTLAALREARGLGYRTGVLTSSSDGYNVYRRLGFVEQCRFGLYLLGA